MGDKFPLLILLILLLAPAFIAIWCGVVYLISHCGWRTFADRYPATEAPEGRWFRRRSGNMARGGSYGNCLNVCLNNAGVYVETAMVFRIGHSSLFVPWEEVARICNRSYHNHKWVALVLEADDKKMRIILPAEAEATLQSLPNDAAHRIDYESGQGVLA